MVAKDEEWLAAAAASSVAAVDDVRPWSVVFAGEIFKLSRGGKNFTAVLSS